VNGGEKKSEPASLLVIGYGNSLRGDDGVGPRVAEAVGGLRLPGVFTITCHQLSPEHAEAISKAEGVVFVDASLEAADGVQFREVTAGETTQLLAHAADPRTLLALARDVYGRAPKAWWLTISVDDLSFSETLSATGQRDVEQAIELIRQFIPTAS